MPTPVDDNPAPRRSPAHHLSIVYSRAVHGMGADPVIVETHLSNGLPQFCIVGLPETAVKESRDRVRSAILNAGFEFPIRRITVNLAPADLPKESGRYDLPIALGILAASQQIPHTALQTHEWVGELALSGELRAISAALPIALGAQTQGRTLVLPASNAQEVCLDPTWSLLGAHHLTEVVAYIRNRHPLQQPTPLRLMAASAPSRDLQDVCGQIAAKRALIIAAAGGHNLLFFGPPGTGKTMLAQRMIGILPPLSPPAALEVAILQALANRHFDPSQYGVRPLRSPHHTASAVALVGGGTHPKPGEISLAHHGVLFLDELPEYDRKVLEVLREPLESGKILISRAREKVEFPAQFQLVAAMNPCPCGHLGDPKTTCRCSNLQIKRYHQKISGPLLDRIDLFSWVAALTPEQLRATQAETGAADSSATVREQVMAARTLQDNRQGCCNAALRGKYLDQHMRASPEAYSMLQKAFEKWHLSARSYHRILRIARTIADLHAQETVTAAHMAEALSYRQNFYTAAT